MNGAQARLAQRISLRLLTGQPAAATRAGCCVTLYSRPRRRRALWPDLPRTPEANLRREQAAPKDGSLLLEVDRWGSWSPLSQKPDMGHLVVREGADRGHPPGPSH
jgi:hypothetical protein